MTSSPAMKIGITKGDRIVAINGKKLVEWQDIYKNINNNAPKDNVYSISYEHDSKICTINVKIMPDNGKRLLGVTVSNLRYPLLQSCKKSLSFSIQATKEIVSSIFKMITMKIKAEVAGPVGIATISGEAFSAGFWNFIAFIAMINLNLGVFNLLPIPALDGGRIFLTLPELITGKKLPAKFENTLNYIGFLLLIALILFVTGIDIYKLFIK